MTVTPHTERKKLTTSALSGSPQLLTRRRRVSPALTVPAPSAMIPRSSVGVVARFVTPSSAMRDSASSGVGVASWAMTVTPMASATM